MTRLTNDITKNESTKEAEERNAPEAKLVEATDFQSVGASSNLVGSTNDWCTEKCGNDFNIKRINTRVAGNDYSRLSVLRT